MYSLAHFTEDFVIDSEINGGLTKLTRITNVRPMDLRRPNLRVLLGGFLLILAFGIVTYIGILWNTLEHTLEYKNFQTNLRPRKYRMIIYIYIYIYIKCK